MVDVRDLMRAHSLLETSKRYLQEYYPGTIEKELLLEADGYLEGAINSADPKRRVIKVRSALEMVNSLLRTYFGRAFASRRDKETLEHLKEVQRILERYLRSQGEVAPKRSKAGKKRRHGKKKKQMGLIGGVLGLGLMTMAATVPIKVMMNAADSMTETKRKPTKMGKQASKMQKKAMDAIGVR